MSHTTLAQGVSPRHTIHVSCACVFDVSSTLSSHSSFVSPIFYFVLDLSLQFFYVDVAGARSPVHFAQWESGPLVNNAPLTGYEPNFFDDYHFSETTDIFIQECSSDTKPLYLVTTPSAERSIHQCSLRSEKNQRAVDKLITLLKKVCCQVSRCLSVM